MSGQDKDILRLMGARIRSAREAAGISQDELAARIGLTRTSVTNIEAGRQDVPLSRLVVLAAALDVELAGLVAAGDLPVVHKVRLRRVYEVGCETCGDDLGSYPDHEAAMKARRDHITEVAP